MKRVCVGLILCLLAMVLPTPSKAGIIKRKFYSNFDPKVIVAHEHAQNAPLFHGGYLSWLDTRLHDDVGKIMPLVYMKDISHPEEKPCAQTYSAKKSGARAQWRNKVVWAENNDRLRPDNLDIRFFDFKKGTGDFICKDKSRQDNPQISADYIIWRDWRDTQKGSTDPWDFSVYGVPAEGGDEFLIKPHDMVGTAELFGEYVAMGYKGEKGDWDVGLFVCSNKKLLPICEASGDQLSPKIVGDVVVWLDSRNSPLTGESRSTDILGYSLSTKNTITISTRLVREYSLAVGGDRFIIWLEDSDKTPLGAQRPVIRGYDIVTGRSFDVTQAPGPYKNICVDAHYVVYEDYTDIDVFGCDIKVFDIFTGKTYWVVKGYGDQRNPRIYGDFVVWENWGEDGSEDADIWGTSVANPSEPQQSDGWGFDCRKTWQMHRSDPRHFAKAVIDNIRPLQTFPMRKQWQLELGDAIYSSSCVSKKGYAYVGCDDSYLYCVSVADGAINWRFKATGKVRSSPALYGDRVFFGDQNGRFFCIDGATGTEIWQVQTAGPIEGSPTTFQNDVDHYGSVVFGSGDRRLYMYNAIANTPILKWSIDLGGWSYSTCAIDYNPLVRTSDSEPVSKVIYIGVSNNRLLCISASTGQLVAEYKTDAPIESSPCCMGSTVFCGSKNGHLYGLDFSLWGSVPYVFMKEVSGSLTQTSPAYDPAGAMLFYEGKAGALFCARDAVLWRLQIDQSIRSSPALVCSKDNMFVFIGSDSGQFVMADAKKGTVIWKEQLSGSAFSSPTIVNTGYLSVVIGTTDHKLTCFGQRPKIDDY